MNSGVTKFKDRDKPNESHILFCDVAENNH